MFGHNYYNKNKIILYCILIVIPILRIVTSNYKSRVYNNTRVGTLIVATIYLQLIQNRYMFRSFLSLSVVTSIVYNPLPAMWKS